jgi:putative membrane protein
MLYRIAIRIATVVAGLFVAANFVDGIGIADIYTAVIVAAILGILNLFVRPVLVVLTLPVTIITLGLFMFVLNAGIFWFVGTFVKGFTVAGFIPALLGSIIVSIAGWIGTKITS